MNSCKRTLFGGLWIALLLGALPVGLIAQDYDGLIQQALQQRNQGEFEAAEASLRQAYPLGRETNEVAYLLGMVLAFQERFIEAMDVIDEALAKYPDDVQLNLTRARVLTYQGIYGEAIDMAEQTIELDPGNPDALNLLARIHVYRRNYDAARAAYRAVLTRDDRNLEALIGLYDTEIAAGNGDAADNWLTQAEQHYPKHIDVVTRRDRLISPVTRPHQLTVGYAPSTFDLDAIPEWHDRFLEYRYLAEDGNQYYLRTEHAHRFGDHDTMTEVGLRWERPGGFPIEVAVAGTPDNAFLPSHRLRLSALFEVVEASERLGATTLDMSLMRSRYISGDVDAVNLNFSHYLLTVNAWLTPGLVLVRDETGVNDLGWRLGAHWQANTRLRLGYTFYDTAETENNITIETSAHHIYGNYQLSDGLDLRLDFSSNDRHNVYTRDTTSLSLQWRF